MRFIRKNGRIIPIKDSASPQKGGADAQAAEHRKKAIKAAGVEGVSLGGAIVGGREALVQAIKTEAYTKRNKLTEAALHLKRGKRALAFAAVSYAGLLGSATVSAYHASKANKLKPLGFADNAKENLKQLGAAALGTGSVLGGYAGLVAAGDAARPAAKKLGAEIKFYRTKKVVSTATDAPRRVKGLLKHG